jgi:hypothetical protein
MNEMGDIFLKSQLAEQCRFMLDSDWIQIEAIHTNQISMNNASVASDRKVSLNLPLTKDENQNADFTVQSVYVRYGDYYYVECEIYRRGKALVKSITGKCGYATRKVDDSEKPELMENGMRPIAQQIAAFLYHEAGRLWEKKTCNLYWRKIQVVDTGGYRALTKHVLASMGETPLSKILTAGSEDEAQYILDMTTFFVHGAGLCLRATLERKDSTKVAEVQRTLENDEEMVVLKAGTEIGAEITKRIESDLFHKKGE